MSTPWVVVRSRMRKHAGAVFIKAGGTFVAKTYGHDGADGEATAALIIERVNGWDTLVARAETAERELATLREDLLDQGREMDLLT